MLKIKFFLCILLILLTTGCANKESNVIETIKVDPDNAEEINILDCMEDINVIQLSSSNDSLLIGNIAGINFHKDKIYIRDEQQNIVFIYNDKGEIVNIISNKGQGPNEYNNISNLYINSRNEQLILTDNELKKKFVYDLNGNFIKKDALPFNIKSFDVLNNKKDVVVRDGVDFSDSQMFIINIFQDNKIVEQYFPFVYDNGATIWEKGFPVRVFNNTFYYNSIFSDTIYFYDNKLYPKYIIDYSNKGVPDNLKNLPQQESTDAIYSYIVDHNGKVAYGFEILKDKNSSMFFAYSYQNGSRYCIYNKKNKTIRQISNINLTKDLSLTSISRPLYNYENDTFYFFFLENSMLLELDESIKNDLKTKYKTLYDKIENLNLEDNPIILSAKMKNSTIK